MRTIEIRLASGQEPRWRDLSPPIRLGVLVLAAVGLALFVRARYLNVAEIFDRGTEGVLSVKSVREKEPWEETDLLCDDRLYRVSLDGRPLNLWACSAFTVGQEYPVIAALDRVQEFNLSYPVTERFFFFGGSRFFVVGSKSRSKWAVFVREMGRGTLAAIVGLETLLMAAAYRTFKRRNGNADRPRAQ